MIVVLLSSLPEPVHGLTFRHYPIDAVIARQETIEPSVPTVLPSPAISSRNPVLETVDQDQTDDGNS
ncbi:MAG: hypothetical protein JSU82_08415 [Rhodospirillales bacterium]|nr:MAG: hypothetical protein JSU82_08415 [Rhodospirillales bacterium]